MHVLERSLTSPLIVAANKKHMEFTDLNLISRYQEVLCCLLIVDVRTVEAS
jgi:hypothetical protein